jgi:hypothetical protein
VDNTKVLFILFKYVVSTINFWLPKIKSYPGLWSRSSARSKLSFLEGLLRRLLLPGRARSSLAD